MRLIDLIVNIFGMLYEQNILPWGNILMIACVLMSMIISFVIMKKKCECIYHEKSRMTSPLIIFFKALLCCLT